MVPQLHLSKEELAYNVFAAGGEYIGTVTFTMAELTTNSLPYIYDVVTEL